jgi:hypothetical protein
MACIYYPIATKIFVNHEKYFMDDIGMVSYVNLTVSQVTAARGTKNDDRERNEIAIGRDVIQAWCLLAHGGLSII